MTLFDTMFQMINLSVAPAWALLILAPGSIWTRRLVHSALYPALLGTVYGVLLFSGIFLGQAHPDAGMTSLGAVGALFSHPVGLLTGWSHFLVFDLFIGAWIARDAARHGLGHFATLPALILAFVFGPLGLLWHLIRRGAAGPGWRLDETAP